MNPHRHRFAGIVLTASLLCLGVAHAAPDWKPVEALLGGDASVSQGVLKITIPRPDLHVTVYGTPIETALALEHEFSFMPHGQSDVMMMGELVLVPGDIRRVEETAVAEGIHISALHQHLTGTTPEVLYFHMDANGDAMTIARHIKTLLSVIKTPIKPGHKPSAAQLKKNDSALHDVEALLGKPAEEAENVITYVYDRTGTITEDGMDISVLTEPSEIRFQPAPNHQTALAGEFSLVAAEVAPVTTALVKHGLTVTAIHNHMLTETPRIFYLHCWGVGSQPKLAAAIKAALTQASLKPASHD